MNAISANGETLTKNIRRETDGTWGANVWFGFRPATTPRRYYYRTRELARKADIGDTPGKAGCIGIGSYMG